MTEKLCLVPTPRKMSLAPVAFARSSVPGDAAPKVQIRPGAMPPQGYRMTLSPDGGVAIVAADEAGAFSARQTLAQLHRQLVINAWLVGEIEDWPDFPVRGVMLDISRDKVPTMATLFMLVDLFAELKINQLQLYTEHTFAYANHPDVWRDASPMTPAEIQELDRYCRARFIELVPNQNSFGHMARWLKHPRYEPLAEKPEGFTFPWGTRHAGGFSLNPLDPRSLELVESLYDELLPNFSSRMINVGCDETFDLGLGKSRADCAQRGKERVYLEFLLKIYDAVRRRGRTMQFWGDIVLHKPELIPELPKDVIALNWGYDADHPFEKETRAFADAGVPFYVCPGTSSWLSITGRTDNALANLKSAAVNGLAHGAIGYLNTDWGDLGHLQYLPVSFLGFAAGAAYAWCYERNESLDISRALDVHVFRDSAAVMGRLMHDLGNVYQAVNTPMGMSTRLFWSLVGGADRRKLWDVITPAEFDDAESRIDQIVARLDAARMDRPDAALIADEIRNAAAMLRFACHHGRRRLGVATMADDAMLAWLDGVIGEHRRLWLSRNRPGGLDDSCKQLEARRAEYA
jgi:hexosaminidase